jgi:hypothetical protein
MAAHQGRERKWWLADGSTSGSWTRTQSAEGAIGEPVPVRHPCPSLCDSGFVSS